MMMYNDYTHDEFSKCDGTPGYSASLAIACRGDLNDPNGISFVVILMILGTYPLPGLGFGNHVNTDGKIISKKVRPLHSSRTTFFSIASWRSLQITNYLWTHSSEPPSLPVLEVLICLFAPWRHARFVWLPMGRDWLGEHEIRCFGWIVRLFNDNLLWIVLFLFDCDFKNTQIISYEMIIHLLFLFRPNSSNSQRDQHDKNISLSLPFLHTPFSAFYALKH